jgi:hypothetical protein
MKPEEFKRELRSPLEKICSDKLWSFDNAKHRGMAFEDWCFNLFTERYPAADNNPDECIIRGDDAEIDIFFESKETEEVYVIQCKHPKISASDPISESEVKSFFSSYKLLLDRKYLDERQTNNPKLHDLAIEFDYWVKSGFLIRFLFSGSGKSTDKTAALVDKYSRDHQDENVAFDVWDIVTLKDEYVIIKSIEEQYPDEVVITLADGSYLKPEGDLKNLTFVVPGTVLQQIAIEHKDSLFNMNIRRFLGRKGEVNSGMRDTLNGEPQFLKKADYMRPHLGSTASWLTSRVTDNSMIRF